MQQARVDFARALILAQIANSIDAARERDEGGEANDQGAEGVHAQESAEGFNRAAREDLRAEPRRQNGDDAEGEQVEPLQHGALAQRPASEAGEQGHQHEKRQQHGFTI